MGKMEQALKGEIIRLAKKELRMAFLPLARDVRKMKRTVAQLRRGVSWLSRLGTEFEAQQSAAAARLEPAPEEAKGARMSPRLLKSLRARLGISQGELAKLVGVSAGAVGFWEQGKAKPRGRNRDALIALRKLGRRDVKRVLAVKKEAAKAAAPAKRGRPAKKAPAKRKGGRK
jgi:DNA-binding transcriptional regulator YiaG